MIGSAFFANMLVGEMKEDALIMIPMIATQMQVTPVQPLDFVLLNIWVAKTIPTNSLTPGAICRRVVFSVEKPNCTIIPGPNAPSPPLGRPVQTCTRRNSLASAGQTKQKQERDVPSSRRKDKDEGPAWLPLVVQHRISRLQNQLFLHEHVPVQ